MRCSSYDNHSVSRYSQVSAVGENPVYVTVTELEYQMVRSQVVREPLSFHPFQPPQLAHTRHMREDGPAN
jgi:hypothetical protein